VDEYDGMTRVELLFRVRDWRELANMRAVALEEAEAERDRLRAVVDATLVWLRQMTDLACAVDVLHVADLYQTVTAGLDVGVTGENT
jgi:hypothetical protein